ncbi:hypothetical protein EUGRSUZ_B03978 [Eucalyptus grandis]|uniref:Uncharacterized protein n=2 Tax=Eucalyptus grandis TaxID=71139 RepID=A0ACC3LZ63_EUCGR|nr:hypothetical protein EUGRSUZ_B03978 [Eucalyptus grandis]
MNLHYKEDRIHKLELARIRRASACPVLSSRSNAVDQHSTIRRRDLRQYSGKPRESTGGHLQRNPLPKNLSPTCSLTALRKISLLRWFMRKPDNVPKW